MKKILTGILGITMGLAGLSAQSLTLTNTFGGNADNSAVKDFLIFNDEWKKEEIHAGDRLQLDAASEHIDSRIRLDFNIADVDALNTEISSHVRVLGYVNWRPVSWLNFIAGNKFFSKWALQGAYLAAADDFSGNGKLADDDGLGIVFDNFGLKVAAAFAKESDWNLNFGIGYDYEKLFSLGITARNVTQDYRSIGGYGRFSGIENLILNAGYTYNYTGGYLQATQHAIQFSAAYKIPDIKLNLNADVLVGLNNKAYNTTSQNVVELASDAVPFYTALRAGYGINEHFTINLKGIVNQVLQSGNAVINTTIYPYFDYATEKFGTFRTGARLNFDSTKGYKGLSIPVSWQYKVTFN